MSNKIIFSSLICALSFNVSTMVNASSVVPHDESRWMFFYNVSATPGSELSTQACKEISTPVHYVLNTKDREANRTITFDAPNSRYKNYVSTAALYIDKKHLLKTATAQETFKFDGKSYSTTTNISLMIENRGAFLQARALWKNDFCQGAYISEPDGSTIPQNN